MEVKLLVKENDHKNLAVLIERKKKKRQKGKDRKGEGKYDRQMDRGRKEGKTELREEFVVRVSDHQHQRKRTSGWNGLVNLQ